MMRPIRRRGFTLMEAMVAMAMAGIISAAAAGAMSLVLRSVSTTRSNMSVATNLNNSLQFISRDVEIAGGQGLPVQSSVIVESDTCDPMPGGIPACGGFDRVHLFTALPDPPVCTVRVGATTNSLSFQYVQGGCCFPASAKGSAVTGAVMLSRTDGAFRPILASGIAGKACEFTPTDLLPNALYLNDPVPATHAAVSASDFAPFVGGQATLVTMRTYYLERGVDSGQAFSRLRARIGVGTAAVDELVMDEIWDFQVAIGVDTNGDRVVSPTEWAFQGGPGVATDPFVLRLRPPRLVQVALVQGIKASVGTDTATVFLRSGDQTVTAPGRAVRAGMVQLSPINTTLGIKQ